MAIKSSYLPWIAHSFTIHTWPSRSMICALISPTFSWTRSVQSFLPFIIASRASLTQSGHKESVVRGQPRVGLDFSQDFSRGLSDHFGVNDGLGLYLLKNWMVLNVTPAVLHNAQSKDFHSLLLVAFAIFTLLREIALEMAPSGILRASRVLDTHAASRKLLQLWILECFRQLVYHSRLSGGIRGSNGDCEAANGSGQITAY